MIELLVESTISFYGSDSPFWRCSSNEQSEKQSEKVPVCYYSSSRHVTIAGHIKYRRVKFGLKTAPVLNARRRHKISARSLFALFIGRIFFLIWRANSNFSFNHLLCWTFYENAEGSISIIRLVGDDVWSSASMHILYWPHRCTVSSILTNSQCLK